MNRIKKNTLRPVKPIDLTPISFVTPSQIKEIHDGNQRLKQQTNQMVKATWQVVHDGNTGLNKQMKQLEDDNID